MCITFEGVEIVAVEEIELAEGVLTTLLNRDIKYLANELINEGLVGGIYGNLQIRNCRLKKKFRR